MTIPVENARLRLLVSDCGPFGMFVDLESDNADIHVMDLVMLADVMRVLQQHHLVFLRYRNFLITIILKLLLLLGAPAAANIIHLRLIFSYFKKPSVASACSGDISLSDFLMHTASGTACSDAE